MTAILVVEDSAPLGRLLLLTLTGAGYEASWAQSGAGALRATATKRPDIVLIDLHLEDARGVDLAVTLHGRLSGTRFVAMSGEAPAADLPPFFDAFLLKPVAIETLLRAVAA